MTLLGRLDRPNRVWFVISGVLVLAIAGCVIGLLATSKANGTEASLRKLCPLARDIGNSVIPPPTPGTATAGTPTGIQDIGYMRIFYQSSCSEAKFGALHPVTDARLAAFLKSQGH